MKAGRIPPYFAIKMAVSKGIYIYIYYMIYNVGKTIIHIAFGNGLYDLFMVMWWMVYYCFTHINDDELMDLGHPS